MTQQAHQCRHDGTTNLHDVIMNDFTLIKRPFFILKKLPHHDQDELSNKVIMAPQIFYDDIMSQ